LTRIRLQRLDAREAELGQVNFVDSEVTSLTADETTRFGRMHPLVHKLILVTEKGVYKEIYEPDEIGDWIAKHSPASEANEENDEALRLFERICRIMLRQHMIKEHPSDPSGRVLAHRYWKEMEPILFDAEVIARIKNKDSKGASAPFLRMRDPFRLLVHRADPKVKAIWRKIGSIPQQ
jgi:hypothetical protein